MTTIPRSRNRRGQGGQLREQILAAACTLLETLGDGDALGMREVAAASGVTPPSVYAHFANKEQLLHAVTGRLFAEFDQALAEAAAGATDPFDALGRRCHAYLHYAVEHRGHYRILFNAPNLGPEAVGADRPHPGAQSYLALVASVSRCQEAGADLDQPAERIAIELWATLHGIADLQATKPELPWPPAADITDSALRHLHLDHPRATPGRSPRRR